MDNFSDEDIILFVNKFTHDVSENPLRSPKITNYVQYLRTKKHFRDNNIEEDHYFKKRYQIETEDIIEIHKLIEKIKRGKDLTRSSTRYNVTGNMNTGYENVYDEFDENIEYKNEGFELMNELQGATDAYYKKMKKSKNSRNWKQRASELSRAEELNRVGSVQNFPNRYYYEGENSERPQIEYDVQGFARSELTNMGTSNIIQKLDKVNSILEDNQLITNDFDMDYKRAHPSLCCNKKNPYHNEINPVEDINQTRFWQDNDILNQRGNTRNTCIKNKNPFEHQFDYLESNYNRVPDPRLIGTGSRMDNRSMMKR